MITVVVDVVSDTLYRQEREDLLRKSNWAIRASQCY